MATASDGAYGTPAYDRNAMYAQVMIQEIEEHLGEAAFFTRDDLMYLPCFQHLATITRYAYVRAAVRHCIERKWIVEGSRMNLVLAGRKRSYNTTPITWEEYYDTINGLMPYGRTFTVVSVLQSWESDHHLTVASKRTIIRNALQTLARRGHIKEVSFNVYVRVENTE